MGLFDTGKKIESTNLLTPVEALKIIYYQMAADGKLDAKELETFDEIGREVDQWFDQDKNKIIEECNSNISREKSKKYYSYNLKECIKEVINSAQSSAAGYILPKLLLWNLVVISLTDNDYSTEEKSLLNSIRLWLNIEKPVYMEMLSTAQTLIALEKEAEWLRNSNSSFVRVNKNLNEVLQRQDVIMQGIHALILD